MLQSMGLKRVRHNLVTEQQPPYRQNGRDKPPLLSENLARGDDLSRGKNISKEKESESVSRSIASSSLRPHEQAPLLMGFSRQQYWSGLPFPSPGDLLDPGIEPGSPALQADSLPTDLAGKP